MNRPSKSTLPGDTLHPTTRQRGFEVNPGSKNIHNSSLHKHHNGRGEKGRECKADLPAPSAPVMHHEISSHPAPTSAPAPTSDRARARARACARARERSHAPPPPRSHLPQTRSRARARVRARAPALPQVGFTGVPQREQIIIVLDDEEDDEEAD
ncbi:hypothetical protein FRC02_006820 [Tulasnella sp. 418]|nr:hypothetical protein FRC02_006820 [Tulasnella sp. 418]